MPRIVFLGSCNPYVNNFCDFLDSGILSLEVLGSPMIILNSAKAINDLLEKKSAQFSNRYVIEFRVSWL